MTNPWTAERVRALRTRLGLSRTALAQRIGASRSAAAHWEQGTRTPTGLYAAALDALDALDAEDDRPSLSTSLADTAAAFDAEAAAAIRDGQPEVAETSQRLAGHLRRLAYTHRAAAAYQGRPALDPPQVE